MQFSSPNPAVATGVSIAALGVENPQGVFEVLDICFADIDRHKPLSAINTLTKFPYVAVASGIDFSPLTGMSFEILVDFLEGSIGVILTEIHIS